jgi:hypothetical protein
MKPSQNTLESLADINQVATLGDVRRIIGQSLLALARKEISAVDMAAMAKGADAIANTLQAEVSLFKLRNEMREHGADLGKLVHIGATLIGSN